MKNRLLLIIPVALALAVIAYFAMKSDGGNDTSSAGGGIAASGSLTDTTSNAGAGSEKKLAPASLSGTVLASDGTPLAAASVSLVPSGEGEKTLSAHDAVQRAGDDGGFSYTELLPGVYTIRANAVGFLPHHETLVLEPGQARRELTLQLVSGGFSLTGTVHDATGGTVAAAVVQAMPLGGNPASASGGLAGHDGTYQMGLANGHYMLWAYHADYVPYSQLVEVSGGPLVVDFRLAPGAVVEGQVKHLGTDAPLPGAIVSYATERQNSLYLWAGSSGAGTVTADDQGQFRIKGLNSGSLRLSAHGDNSTTKEPTRIALGIAEQRSDVELFVDTAFRVSGRVVDASTGDAVSDMRVSLASPEGASTAGGARSNEDGTFEIHSVPAGEYRIRSQGKHYMLDMFGTPVAVEADTNVGDIKVDPGAMVRGRVEPATQAEISIDFRSLSGMTPGAFAQVQSELDGTFEIGPFTPSKFRLQADTGNGLIGSKEVDVPASGLSDVIIPLAPGASLAGTVVDAKGKPVSGVRVSLRQEAKGESLRVVVNGLDRTSQSAISSPDGSFRIQGLTGGDYQVQVLDEQMRPMAWAGSAKSSARNVSIGPKEARSGEVLKVEARNASIVGRVLGPDGQPAVDTWVSASLSRAHELRGPMPAPTPRATSDDGEDEEVVESRSEVAMVMMSDGDASSGGAPGLDLSRAGELPPVLTDSEGNFAIRGLRNGEYDLVAEGMRGAARGIVKRARTGENIEVRLVMLTRIEGVVTQGGEPVSRYTVELGGSGFARKQVRNDKGKFTLHRLDPGTYTVTVRGAEGEGEAQVEVVAGKTTEVEIPLEQLTTVSGIIVDEAGNPIAGVLTIPTPKRDDGNVNLRIGDDVTPTGADGSFELAVKPGSYLLIVMKMGAGPIATVPFEATGGSALDLGTITGKPGGPGPGGPGHDEEGPNESGE